MSATLTVFGTLMGGREGAALATFSQVFNGMGDVKAAAVATQVAKNWRAEGREAKCPAELQDAVRRIYDTLVTMGAKTQAGVFEKVLQLLTGNEDEDLESFVGEAIAARVKWTPVELAGRLAQRLKSVVHDRRRFDALLNEYEGRCKPAEIRAMAESFIGESIGKKNKPDIIRAVRNWQREGELNRCSHASQAKAAL
jgi:hypothetical protein